MDIYYKEGRCTYGTYRVNGEDKPVFYLNSHPSDVKPYEAGFEEVQYGLWCHFLDIVEYKKMEAFLKRYGNE